jgi:hypothetical protein
MAEGRAVNRTPLNFLLLLAGVMLCIPGCEGSTPTGDKEELLSIEETVDLAKRGSCGPVSAAELRRRARANPAARPALYRILSDETQKTHWPPVVAFFALIGQDDDVDKLIEFVRNRRGVLQGGEYGAVVQVSNALGGMAARGCTKAHETLDKMITPSYWAGMNFRLYSKRPEGYPTFENAMVARVLIGYAYANDPQLPDKARALLKKIRDAEQRKIMGQKVEDAIAYYEAVQRQLRKNKTDKN